jgi:4-hydroxy-tetrahydrodipicolinate synthase
MAGSTGEAATLDEREFSTLLEFAVERISRRVPVLAGTGLSGTRKTIAQTQRAKAAGVDFALVVAPPYVRPTQEGLYRHFCEVAEQGGLPVVLYNVPTRTSCDLLPETTRRLAAHGNIVGIKEARPEPERMDALLAFASDRFRVLSGDDPTAARAMLSGAAGVVSVVANVAPAAFAELCTRSAARDADGANALDRRLRPLYAFLGIEPNPIPVKWCLGELGFGTPGLRLPLQALSAVHHAAGRDLLVQLGLIEAERAVS